MNTTRAIHIGVVAAGIAFFVAASLAQVSGQRDATGVVSFGNSDIGGVVASANGLESGVWVIAETADLPTKFAKVVVTDDNGRYLIPDLPKANYNVWVRGYGLVDSPKIKTVPGKSVNLSAVVASTPVQAAEY